MKIIYLVGITILLMGCERFITRNYRLENATDHEIKINLYGFDGLNTSTHKNTRGLIYEGVADNKLVVHVNASVGLGSDSVFVIFDNKKIHRHYYFTKHINDSHMNPSKGRYIYDDNEYEAVNDELYVFTFTEEDYENAAECDGACE